MPSAPKGTDGPVLRRYRPRPVTRCLAFGFYGERGREVGYFAAGVAKKGGSAPERFGCCHGAEQTTRVASSWVRGHNGRLALRESAMAIEVALGISLGK